MRNKKLFGLPPALAVALTGVIAALGVGLSFLERLLTGLIPLPPGAKLGLANVAVTVALCCLGFGPALVAALARSGFVFLVSGGISAAMSLCGGMAALLVTAAGVRLMKRGAKISYFAVSVVSACVHNLAQLGAASFIGSAPPGLLTVGLLLLFGVVFGSITGIVLNVLVPVVNDRLEISR